MKGMKIRDLFSRKEPFSFKKLYTFQIWTATRREDVKFINSGLKT